MKPVRINIGSGAEIVPGYLNLDHSPLLLLHFLAPLARWLPIGSGRRATLLQFHRSRREMRYARIRTRLPLRDSSVSVIYTSHFLEHLSREEALALLKDCRRCLAPGGVVRVCVPNLRYEVSCYLERTYETDQPMADRFIERLLFAKPSAVTWAARLTYLVRGPRMHQWMYDEDSLVHLFKTAGFTSARAYKFRESAIPEIALLDLERRAAKSLYVEAS